LPPARGPRKAGSGSTIVLSQLSLVTERDLAGTYGRLLGLPVAPPSRYPSEPLWAERL